MFVVAELLLLHRSIPSKMWVSETVFLLTTAPSAGSASKASLTTAIPNWVSLTTLLVMVTPADPNTSSPAAASPGSEIVSGAHTSDPTVFLVMVPVAPNPI